MNTVSQWDKQETCYARATRCGSMSITTPVSLLAIELNVRSVLHGQVSLAAVDHICVIHEVMNGCKKSKGSLKDCFENVNILKWLIWTYVNDEPAPRLFAWNKSGFLGFIPQFIFEQTVLIIHRMVLTYLPFNQIIKCAST